MSKSFAFRRFLVSRGAGAVCDQFLMFAVPLAVLQSTGRVSLSAFTFVIEWIPRVLGFPVVGALIDGLPIRKVLLCTDSFRCVVTLAAAAYLSMDPALGSIGSFVVLSTMMALMSIAQVANFLCAEVVIPNNLPSERFSAAHSATQAIDQAAQVIGPLLAAALYSTMGMPTLLAVCSLALAASAANYLRIRIRDSSAGSLLAPRSIIDSNQAAFRLLVRCPAVLYLSVVTSVVNLIFGTTMALAAAVTVGSFGKAPATFGILQSTAAVCAIIAFAAVSRLATQVSVSLVGRVSLGVILASGAVLGCSTVFVVFAIGYCLLIAFDGAFNVYIRTMRSVLIPREHLGKVMGVVGLLSLLSMPIGGAAASVLSQYMALPQVILTMSIMAIVALLILTIVGRRNLSYNMVLP